MKKKSLYLLSACLLMSSCATVRQNVDARTLLAKCQYEFAGISAAGVQFGKDYEIDSVDFNVLIKVTNTADRDIAVDHAEFAFYLDKSHMLDLDHKRFARIAPSSSSVETISVGLPFAEIVKSLGHRPEKVGVKAKLWVTLLVGKDTWETPVMIPVEVEMNIPYDQIDAIIAQKKKQLEDEAKAKLETEAKAKAQDEAQKLAPNLPIPRF